MDAVLPRLYALVARGATGVVWIRGAAPWLRLELVSGWVHAFAAIAPPADPEQLAAAARARPAHDATAAFRALVAEMAGRAAGELGESDEPRVRLGATTPFHPSRALRAVAAAALAEAASLAESWTLGDDAVALSLDAPLHGSALDPDEQRLGKLLAGRALPLAELVARAGCPPPRARALIAELAALGTLRADGRAIAIDLFGLVDRARAAAAARRRAYHAEARKVHPDLRPDAADEERATLTAQMADLAKRNKQRAD